MREVLMIGEGFRYTDDATKRRPFFSERVMNRRGAWLGILMGYLALLLFVLGAAAGENPILIGALNDSWGPTPADVGLRDGLVKLGYRENEEFFLGIRFTQGDTDALLEAARGLVGQGVTVLFTSQPGATIAAQRVTTQIPIVFTEVDDPLGLGLVQSFARPGGNITGVTTLGSEVAPKRLELFQQMVPGLKRVLLPYNPAHPYADAEVKVYREGARQLGLVLIEQPLQTQDEAQTVLARLRKGNVDGIISPRPLSLNIPGFILETASQQDIPTMFPTPFWVDRGGLVSYGPDFHESGRMAARLVDKIIKGENPANIPVEVNPKIEFVINLKTAKALGLTLDPIILYRADRLVR
jgi:putative ABC transport system substrate-binding protein